MLARALLLVLLCACDTGGSETGNPVVTRMGLGLRSGDPDVIDVGSSGAGGTVLQEAWLAFGEVTLLSEDECANLGEIDIFGPTLVAADLARGDTRIRLEVAAQAYCGLAVPLNLHSAADELPEDAPEGLADHSIVLRGMRADGTPFELMHAEQETLELAGDFDVEPDGPALLLYFDVAQWMQGIDLDAAELGDDGVIHIDVEHNRALLDAYEVNLECSLELYSDVDEDGLPSDDDPVLARCFED
jgi:hypothetical protein